MLLGIMWGEILREFIKGIEKEATVFKFNTRAHENGFEEEKMNGRRILGDFRLAREEQRKMIFVSKKKSKKKYPMSESFDFFLRKND